MDRTAAVTWLAVAALAQGGCVASIAQDRIEGAMDEIWHQRQLDQLGEYYDEAIVDEVHQFVFENLSVWPDARIVIDNLWVRGDTFIVEWTVTGTHRDFGETLSLSGVNINRYVDGKVVEERRFFDQLKVYQDLGFQLLPPGMTIEEEQFVMEPLPPDPVQAPPEPEAPPAP